MKNRPLFLAKRAISSSDSFTDMSSACSALVLLFLPFSIAGSITSYPTKGVWFKVIHCLLKSVFLADYVKVLFMGCLLFSVTVVWFVQEHKKLAHQVHSISNDSVLLISKLFLWLYHQQIVFNNSYYNMTMANENFNDVDNVEHCNYFETTRTTDISEWNYCDYCVLLFLQPSFADVTDFYDYYIDNGDDY